MTFEQIKKALEIIRKFENQKKETSLEKMEFLLDRTIDYFRSDIDFDQLFLRTYQFGSNATRENFIDDCNTIIFTLEGVLAKDKNYSTVKDVLKDIDLYKKCKSNKSIKKAIKKIYYSYSDRIEFNKIVEKIVLDEAKGENILSLNNGGFDKELLDGILKNLENYANDICTDKHKINNKEKQVQQVPQINITNNNSFTANVNIDIDIENAIKELENACLSTEQEKAVRDKIDEIGKIIKSKETKKNRWAKICSILKWLAEQGIQVAGIILPLLTKAI